MNRSNIIDIINQDAFYRRQKSWPLASTKAIDSLIEDSAEPRLPKDCFVISESSPQTVLSTKALANLLDKFSLIQDLLLQFYGKIIAAGGAIFKAFNPVSRGDANGDIDIFFHGIKEQELNQVLLECVNYLVHKWQTLLNDQNIRGKSFVTRNKYVVTVYLCSGDNNKEYGYDFDSIYKYQFILRSYPSPDTILGGFDIGPCMIGFDGVEFLATPLGLWSMYNRSVIVDTKRRSTSYEYRLIKYKKYGCSIILPGLPPDYKNEEQISKFELTNNIDKLIKQCGYTCNKRYTEDFVERNVNNTGKTVHLPYVRVKPLTNIYRLGRKRDKFAQYNICYEPEIPEKGLKKISDYYDNPMFVSLMPSANATRLRCNNFKALVNIVAIESTNLETTLCAISKFLTVPDFGLGDESNMELIYKTRVDRFLTHGYRSRYNYIKLFAEYANRVMIDESIIPDITQIMIKRMKINKKKGEEQLGTVEWVTKNPGRQWTSSINPIIKNSRDWYGKDYIPVLIGIPEPVETTLRCMWYLRIRSPKNLFHKLPRDVFKMLLNWIARGYAEKGIIWNKNEEKGKKYIEYPEIGKFRYSKPKVVNILYPDCNAINNIIIQLQF